MRNVVRLKGERVFLTTPISPGTPLQSESSKRKSSAATEGNLKSVPAQPKLLFDRTKSAQGSNRQKPPQQRPQQPQQILDNPSPTLTIPVSGSGTITFFNESVKQKNKFIILKQQKQHEFQQKNQYARWKSPEVVTYKAKQAKVIEKKFIDEPCRTFYAGNRLPKQSIRTTQESNVVRVTQFKSKQAQKEVEKVKQYVEELRANSQIQVRQQNEERKSPEPREVRNQDTLVENLNTMWTSFWSQKTTTTSQTQPGRPRKTVVSIPRATQSLLTEGNSQVRSKRHCSCPKDPRYPMFCNRARKWYSQTGPALNNDTMAEQYAALKLEYKRLLSLEADHSSTMQIERDLGRTFPRHPYFRKQDGGKGHAKLGRVLIAFSNLEREVCYVQGMNFIVAQLLLHSSETFAFWLFVALIRDYGMREVYDQRLSGLFKHSHMLEVLIRGNMASLHKKLVRFNLRANVYAGEWIFGLFASVIPCEHIGLFFDNFFEHQWVFFYQLVLTLLLSHEAEIKGEEDIYNLLRSIKVGQQDQTKDIGTDKKDFLRDEDGDMRETNLDTSRNLVSDNDDDRQQKVANQQNTSFFTAMWSHLTENFAVAEKGCSVSDSNYWPWLITRSRKQWPTLDRQANVVRFFEFEAMGFSVQLPEESEELRFYLEALDDH